MESGKVLAEFLIQRVSPNNSNRFYMSAQKSKPCECELSKETASSLSFYEFTFIISSCFRCQKQIGRRLQAMLKYCITENAQSGDCN